MKKGKSITINHTKRNEGLVYNNPSLHTMCALLGKNIKQAGSAQLVRVAICHSMGSEL